MTRVKGPKDGEIIKASFNGKAKSRFPSLKTTKDLVLLSIKNNEFCSGEYLGAMIQQAVDTHQTVSGVVPSGKATFLVADEIYWHNLKEPGATTDQILELKKEAVGLGDDYINQNLGYFLAPLGISADAFNSRYNNKSIDEKIDIINQMAALQGKNFEIIRWKKWVGQNNSHETIKAMQPLYESVEGLKVAVDKSVQSFTARHGDSEASSELWVHRSKGYLTEESPSIMWLAATLGYNFVIYPGEILPPFQATKDYFIVENHLPHISKGQSFRDECSHNPFCLHVEDPSLLVNWLEVDFRRSHAPKITQVSDSFALTSKKFTFFNPGGGDESIGPSKENALVKVSDPEPKIIIEKPQTKSSSTELSYIFEGITRGILETDLPSSDKLKFLIQVVDSFIKTHPQAALKQQLDVAMLQCC